MKIPNFTQISGVLTVFIFLLTGCSAEYSSGQAQGQLEGNQQNSSGNSGQSGNWAKDSSIKSIEPTLLEEEVIEQITDEFGTYSKTKTSYPQLSEVLNLGVQPEELRSAIEFFTDYVMTEIIDSPALDNHKAYDEWVENSAPKYIDEKQIRALTKGKRNGNLFAPVFNNIGPIDSKGLSNGKTNHMIPRLVRDGGPRVINKKMWGIEASKVPSGVHLSATGSAVLITTIEQTEIRWYQIHKEQPDLYEASPCISENQVVDQECIGLDLKQELFFPIQFHVSSYLTQSGNSWKISSYSNFFVTGCVGGSCETTPPTGFLVDLREKIRQN